MGDSLSFIAGFTFVLVLGTAVRILLGMRLNLYFINREHAFAFSEPGIPGKEIVDQSVIPITTENRRRSIVKTLLKKQWREDVDLTLMDDHGQVFTFRVGFHLWSRFYLVLRAGPETAAALDGRVIDAQRRYSLRTGTEIRVGDREYAVLVSPRPMGPDLHRGLYDPIT